MKLLKKAYDDQLKKGQLKAFLIIMTTTSFKPTNGFSLETEVIAKNVRKKNYNKKNEYEKKPKSVVFFLLQGAILSKLQIVKRRRNKTFLKLLTITVIRKATIPKLRQVKKLVVVLTTSMPVIASPKTNTKMIL